MRPTRFKYQFSPQEYWLEGNIVCWDSDYGVQRLDVYDPELIDSYFAAGMWVEVPTQEQEENETQSLTITSEGTLTAVAAAESFADRRAIASDGRSSSYYDIGLPQWLITRILERQADGRAYIKTEELIEFAFDDDFDAGNAFKSLVRLWGAFNGAGKAGNSVSYEKNKIEYSVGKLEQRFTRKQEAA